MNLLNLPIELLYCITNWFDCGDDLRSLLSLLSTCKLFYHISLPILYREPTVEGDYISLRIFCDVLKARPELASYVRELDILLDTRTSMVDASTPPGNWDQFCIPTLPNCTWLRFNPVDWSNQSVPMDQIFCWISHCPKLEMLHIEELTTNILGSRSLSGDEDTHSSPFTWEINYLLPSTVVSVLINLEGLEALDDEALEYFWAMLGPTIPNLIIYPPKSGLLFVHHFQGIPLGYAARSLVLAGRASQYASDLYRSLFSPVFHMESLTCDLPPKDFYLPRSLRLLDLSIYTHKGSRNGIARTEEEACTINRTKLREIQRAMNEREDFKLERLVLRTIRRETEWRRDIFSLRYLVQDSGLSRLCEEKGIMWQIIEQSRDIFKEIRDD